MEPSRPRCSIQTCKFEPTLVVDDGGGHAPVKFRAAFLEINDRHATALERMLIDEIEASHGRQDDDRRVGGFAAAACATDDCDLSANSGGAEQPLAGLDLCGIGFDPNSKSKRSQRLLNL